MSTGGFNRFTMQKSSIVETAMAINENYEENDRNAVICQQQFPQPLQGLGQMLPRQRQHPTPPQNRRSLAWFARNSQVR